MNSSFWDPYGGDVGKGAYNGLLTDIVMYQDGTDSGTDIWIAVQDSNYSFVRQNVTSPFGFNVDAYSGQPDMKIRYYIFNNIIYYRGGIAFTSQKYDQGDIFIIDHVFDTNPEQIEIRHWTKIRRLTNAGEVGQIKISNFIPIIAN